MVVIDTSIIIDHLRQHPEKKTILDKLYQTNSNQQLALSIVSIQELYVGASTRSKQVEQLLLAILGPLRILPYTYDIAQLAGEITRDTKKIVSFADSAIAATCIVNGAALLTLNQKDYLEIKNLELFKF